MRALALAAVLIGMAGCGGGGSSSVAVNTGGGTTVTTPQNLTVSGPASNVLLQWDPVDGAARYNVYYSTDLNQDISIYAAFANAGLEQPTAPTLSLDFTGTTEPVFFRVTAEAGSSESEPALGVAVLSFQPNGSDPSLIDDFAGGLQWHRCSVGQTWSEAQSTCTGTATVITDSAAKTQYGSVPPATGARPPAFTEVVALLECGMFGTSNAAIAFRAMCREHLRALFPSQDGVYPAFFVYDDDDLAPDAAVCASHYLAGTTGCALPDGNEVRASLVQPAP